MKNAPQINQRLIVNALYGYFQIVASPYTIAARSEKLVDVFSDG